MIKIHIDDNRLPGTFVPIGSDKLWKNCRQRRSMVTFAFQNNPSSTVHGMSCG